MQIIPTINLLKKMSSSQMHWLAPVIPATQHVEIRRIVVPGQPRQTDRETPS
jgi:hypothetical protein